MRTQLVACRAVAEQLVIARLVAERRADGVRVEVVGDAADPDSRLTAAGGLLPGPGATLAGPTFEAWLDTAVAVSPGN